MGTRGRLLTAWAIAAATLAILPAGAAARLPFRVGASSVAFSPPLHGQVPGDASNCGSVAQQAIFNGPRKFAFEEPYQDQDSSGTYDIGESYLDCNGNSRWDGNFIGGGSDTPRLYTKVADDVGARAMVVSNGRRTIGVEVLDNEGAFNVYLEQIRQQVAADGVHLDGIFISSNHDESAPDTLGINGFSDPATGNLPVSSVNDYFNDYMVKRSAQALERAAQHTRPATIRYAEAREPANMRQCWSSYPFIDDTLMPSLQALDHNGNAIVTLGDVSQHAETLGFNGDPTERLWVSSDWPNFFRKKLEHRFGGVAIEMAGSVGSVESPEVFPSPISRIPQEFSAESHPAGCRTLFDTTEEHVPIGYHGETAAYGNQLARAVGRTLIHRSDPSGSKAVWGRRADICVPLTNQLFAIAAAIGTFANRPGYDDNCTVENPVSPNGSTSGQEVKSQVAAFRIGDGTFASVPGEVFPFTYLRGFVGPDDMPFPQYSMPPWLTPHMHTPYRFIDGLGEDMIGYIFPKGNGVGVPGENGNSIDPSSTDRFGCGHSDDSEAASSDTSQIAGEALVQLLDASGRKPERVVRGRYVMPDDSLSRDPLGSPEIKCDVDQTFNATGPAVAVRTGQGNRIEPSAWMSLSGRRQATPDRDTRGFLNANGKRVWLDVFPEPASGG
jgi:hypothetical protein